MCQFTSYECVRCEHLGKIHHDLWKGANRQAKKGPRPTRAVFRGWYCLRILWEQSHPLDLQGVDLFGTTAMCWPQCSEKSSEIGRVFCRGPADAGNFWFGDPFRFSQFTDRNKLAKKDEGLCCLKLWHRILMSWAFGLHSISLSTFWGTRNSPTLWTSWHYGVRLCMVNQILHFVLR